MLGPHGVGKTTTLEAVKTQLDDLNRKFHIVHHLEYKKVRQNIIPKYSNKKFFFKNNLLIKYIKLFLVSIYDELIYLNNINQTLREARNQNIIVIFDRYIYDRHIDLKINKRSIVSVLLTKISCYILRRPTLAFILNDQAERIYSRNHEYTITNIEYYQRSIINLCNNLSVRYELIDINNQTPQTMSNQILEKINKEINKT